MVAYYDRTRAEGSSNRLATLSGKQEARGREKCANMLGRVTMRLNEAEKQHAWLIMSVTVLREDHPGSCVCVCEPKCEQPCNNVSSGDTELLHVFAGAADSASLASPSFSTSNKLLCE